MIVEADGGQHNENAKDQARDAWLQSQGFKLLRFWNNEILQSADAVLAAIWAAVAQPLSPSPSPTRGEGSR